MTFAKREHYIEDVLREDAIQSPRPHGSYGNPIGDGRLRRKGLENHGHISIFAELPLINKRLHHKMPCFARTVSTDWCCERALCIN